MLYHIKYKADGISEEFGVFKCDEAHAFSIGNKILDKLKTGEVVINRRRSIFLDWDWWLTLSINPNKPLAR